MRLACTGTNRWCPSWACDLVGPACQSRVTSSPVWDTSEFGCRLIQRPQHLVNIKTSRTYSRDEWYGRPNSIQITCITYPKWRSSIRHAAHALHTLQWCPFVVLWRACEVPYRQSTADPLRCIVVGSQSRGCFRHCLLVLPLNPFRSGLSR